MLAFLIPLAFASKSSPCLLQGIYIQIHSTFTFAVGLEIVKSSYYQLQYALCMN